MAFATQLNNEVYTFRETRKQPDKHHFEATMVKEISAMFDNKIWSTVIIKEIDDYYDSLKRKGVDFQRKRLNLI